ncbi:hypothetical protein [Konateibacter massiliensis]|uniref:hypothetical protein n=1 Tax=Konateibacter massiliensis TaxID=2002841 RepID=UPI000C15C903|nr:hypothetical protein [Konateibacter massiliensis]
MKKLASLVLSSVLVVSLLAGCGSSNKAEESTTTDQAATTTEEATTTETTETADEATTETTDAATTEGTGVKTGLAVTTSIASSTDAGAEDGLGEVDSTVAAVLVDADGKILACKIDAVQTKINFSAEGKITTDLATEVQSKQELGTGYGMGKASAIGKEWNEQADAFAAYVVGKTVDEVKGIAVAEGKATDADLTASVTIHVTDFIATVEKAVNNAKDLGASSDDKLGLATSTTIDKSTDATAEAEGLAQAYSYYTALTTSADGKITSSVIDATQGNVNFDTTGKVTSDLAAETKTKQELGADYGMAKASAIGKEWNEQADAFAAYVTGKTVDEVKGIAVSDEGVATDADLVSSVTVHVTSFITIVEKAVASAK